MTDRPITTERVRIAILKLVRIMKMVKCSISRIEHKTGQITRLILTAGVRLELMLEFLKCQEEGTPAPRMIQEEKLNVFVPDMSARHHPVITMSITTDMLMKMVIQ